MIKKLANALLLISFAITCALLAWHYHLQQSIIPQYQEDLWNMADKRSDEVNAFLQEQEKNATQLTQELFDLTNPESINSLIASRKETMGFKNILLVDDKGMVTFSTSDKIKHGEHIIKNNIADSALGESYQRARMTLTNDFSDFAFNTLLQETALFVSIVHLKNKKFTGALLYQIDEEKIYRITHQYIGLGKTGEVVLIKREEENIIFVTATRNDPDIALQKRNILVTFLGTQDVGVITDYRKKTVIAAWTFIPKIDWEIIVKIDQEEVMASLQKIAHILFLFFGLFLLLFAITCYLYAPSIRRALRDINRKPPFNAIPAFMKNLFFIIAIISLVFMIKNVIICVQERALMISNAQQVALNITKRNATTIEAILEKIVFIQQSMSNDIRTSYLAKEDISTRIKRDMMENDNITNISILFSSYMYDEHTKIYGKSISKIDGTYQEKELPESAVTSAWYTTALEHTSTWIVNQPSEKNPEYTATYAEVFRNKNNEIQGVIAITFLLRTIIRSTEYSGIGQTGYSIITTNTGIFVSHPIASLVRNHITLLQFAQSNGNEELAKIAQKALEGKPLLASYASPTTRELYWIATHPISVNNWIVGTLFAENEIDLSAQALRRYYFWILLWLIITLLSSTWILWSAALIAERHYVIITNIVLMLGLIATWYTITNTRSISRESRTIITDQSSLDKFLNDLNEEAHRKHEPMPINVPCGLLLNSIIIPDPDHIETSGYLWTKYNITEHADIIRGIDLPQSTRMVMGKPLTSLAGNWETETWNIQGILAQEQHNAHYPFDQQRLRIILEHKDIEKNIILTPDLVAYKKISPESTPGLDRNFSLSGFTVEQTFFEYLMFDPKANFGFKEYGKVTDHFQLIFNIILHRNLLNPFVLYILPLLVILFSLFCTLLFSGKSTSPFSVLGPYTGLFFSLIVLQRSLREQHPSGSTLYMEYAFFYTYITIILLILHAIIMHFYKRNGAFKDRMFHAIKLLFWPFQFITWLVTTLIVFY